MQLFRRCPDLFQRCSIRAFIMALLCAAALPTAARERDRIDYGMGLITNVPFADDEVAQVIKEVAENGIIRGTKEYNKDEYLSGAEAVTSSNLFPAWTDGGKVFYKVRKQALDPRNFRESNDVGTVAVRYVVQVQGERNSVVRIDAIFVEDFRHTVHRSNGAVENSEYKVIQDRLDTIELMRKQAAEVKQERQPPAPEKNFAAGGETAMAGISSDWPSADPAPDRKEWESESRSPAVAAAGETLEQHIANLRQELERLVKAPGAPLKSAPFHSASTMSTLPARAEILIVIMTPYWYGVETRDGQHGWIPREQVELLP